MALSPAQTALLDRVLERARKGQLTRPYVSGNVVARWVDNGKTLRLRISGRDVRNQGGDWLRACIQRVNNGIWRPAPSNNLVIIDISFPAT